MLNLLLAAIPVSLYWLFKHLRYRLPPGPVGYPVIGNIFDIPSEVPWLRYYQMSQTYDSDVICLNLLGTPLVALNSQKAVSDLLEKRSAIYSDRPKSVMLHELTGWDRAFGLLDAGEWWRTHRRVFHHYFNDRVVVGYAAKTSLYAKRLLKRLLDDPENFSRHILRMSGALMINISYGFDAVDDDDHWLVAAEKAMNGMDEMGKPGKFLVDVFPILKYLPSWLPGVQFKKIASEYRRNTEEMFENPYEAVRDRLRLGTAETSVATALVTQMETEVEKEKYKELSVSVLGSAFAGGQDTTATVILWFIQAMILYPQIQHAAQEELDRVVGLDRLPELCDQDALPLISAIMYETLRWRPITPLGMPRLLREDDEYNGYHIPAGSIVFANIWAVLHDETVYSNPEQFNPYRFLTPDGKIDPDVPKPEAAFGFGRRICPGRFFSYPAMWINMASILSAFKIEKPVDCQGNVIEVVEGFTHDAICHPTPFEAAFKPRSDAAAEIIRAGVSSGTY